MKKQKRIRLMFTEQTIRVLAGPQLATVGGGTNLVTVDDPITKLSRNCELKRG